QPPRMDGAGRGRALRPAMDRRSRRRQARALRLGRARGDDGQGNRSCSRPKPEHRLFAAPDGSERLRENGVALPPARHAEDPVSKLSARIGWLGPFAAALAFAASSLADSAGGGSPVIGGVVTKACGFPSTVSFGGWGSCSGTLIHPKV